MEGGREGEYFKEGDGKNPTGRQKYVCAILELMKILLTKNRTILTEYFGKN